MKRLLFLLSLLMASSFLWAQTVPQGINYQAVLRHASGQIISDKPVSVKVTILDVTNDHHYYEEVHQITSSSEGVVQMIIGAGKPVTGSFNSIPWSVANLWANIAYDVEGRGHYESIGVMQLLSVPYAFYAESAGKTKNSDSGEFDEEGDIRNTDVIEKFWKTNGNQLIPFNFLITEPEHVLDNQPLLPQFLGTTTFMPLQIKTADTLRAFMLPLGDFYLLKNQFIYGSLDVKGHGLFHQDLIVKGDLFSDGAEFFNLLVHNNAQVLNNLRVGNDLDVDNDVNIDGDLDVFGISRFNNTTESTTKDNGAIIIEGGVGIEKNVNIGGNTEIDGTLGVDGISYFKNTTQSTTKDNGAVVIEGGIGIEKNINVGGNAAIGGTLDLGGKLTINDATQSTAPDNGALVVIGGVGVGKNLNVGGALGVANMSPTTLTGTLTVEKATDLKSSLNVDGSTSLNSNLIVDGPTTLNSTLAANGQVTIDAFVTGGDASYDAYPLRVQGSQQGIAIKLNPEFPNETNNFITFFGSGMDNTRGRIEGQTGLTGIARNIAISIIGDEPSEGDSEDTNDDKNQDPQGNATFEQFFGSNYAFDAINQTVDFVYTIVTFAVNLTACLAGVAVFGDCDDIVWSTIDLIKTGAQLVALIAVNEANIGVTYESGGADYAEWMCRFDSLETIAYGEIVGMRGGKISKKFETAERFMVISDKPGVLGAMPEADKEHLYEKIAFMGQVPVKVMGEVQIGDYILPSGKGDGMGIAVHPDKVLVNDYKRIIGVAWSASKPKTLVNYINTAVGLHQNQLADVVEQMQSVMNEMQLALQRLSPEYQATYFETSGNNKSSNQQITQITESDFEKQLRINQELNHYANVQEQLADVKAYAESAGINFADYPLLAQLMENPTKENAEAVTAYYTKALERGQQMLMEAQKHKKG